MKREFIYFRVFEKNWRELGLTDDDLRELENAIIADPNIGRLIKGTGGLRKMRLPLFGRGKSGGIRVLYVDFISYEKVAIMNVYSKSAQETITDEQKREYKKLIDLLAKELRK